MFADRVAAVLDNQPEVRDTAAPPVEVVRTISSKRRFEAPPCSLPGFPLADL